MNEPPEIAAFKARIKYPEGYEPPDKPIPFRKRLLYWGARMLQVLIAIVVLPLMLALNFEIRIGPLSDRFYDWIQPIKKWETFGHTAIVGIGVLIIVVIGLFREVKRGKNA